MKLFNPHIAWKQYKVKGKVKVAWRYSRKNVEHGGAE